MNFQVQLIVRQPPTSSNVVKHVITDGSTIVLPGWTLEDDGSGLQFIGNLNPTVTLQSDFSAPGRLLLGGDVTFQAQPTIATNGFVFAVGVADFNGDGIPDLASAHRNNPTLFALQVRQQNSAVIALLQRQAALQTALQQINMLWYNGSTN